MIRLTLLATLCLGACALAHGGMYRGPFPGPGGPLTGGPNPLPPGAIPVPLTGGGRFPDLAGWQVWWEFNKDPYLRLRDRRALVVGSDEFYLGAHRPDAGGGAATDEDRQKRIYPALQRALPLDSGSDLVTACLIARAKIAAAHPELDPSPECLELLQRGDQEIRETAALALGLSRRPDAVPRLAALALDSLEGRKLCGRGSVDDRTRAFALYGLGLIGEAAKARAVREQVLSTVERVLGDKALTSRDVKVAAVHAAKGLRPSDESSAGKRLVLRACELLWAYYRQDLGKTEQVAQAHVPAAIARLLGRGQGPDRDRFKKAFAAELGDAARHDSLRQSAALALGGLALAEEEAPAEAEWSRALEAVRSGGKDQQTRAFALIALARIGGAKNRARLQRAHEDARGNERGWAALALGLWAWHAKGTDDGQGSARAAVGSELLRALDHAQAQDHRAALAVALGLAGHEPAVAPLLVLLDANRSNDELAGYACIGLGLLGDGRAIAPIRALVAASPRRPELLKQAASALAKLGDEDATTLLLGMLRDDSPFLAKLGAVAAAIGVIGDRRSLAPLLDLLQDRTLGKLPRAFVAAALGSVGDPAPLPWNASIAADTNYRAWVETLTDQRSGVLDIL